MRGMRLPYEDEASAGRTVGAGTEPEAGSGPLGLTATRVLTSVDDLTHATRLVEPQVPGVRAGAAPCPPLANAGDSTARTSY